VGLIKEKLVLHTHRPVCDLRQ